MQRDLAALTSSQYDLAVVGGGIFGICVAWDAALRGLSVALLEQGDFAQAASANCFKMVHGGIRYLQHGDVSRIRESCQERTVLLRIAPHLVHPLPIVIPTYGHGLKGREILKAGGLLYDLLTFDRNRTVRDPSRRIPWARSLSAGECARLFEDLPDQGLTGGLLFHDGQMYSPARLALAFLASAVERGAEVANYAQVTGFLKDGDALQGVTARDVLTEDVFEVRARMVLIAAGGWSTLLMERGTDRPLRQPITFSRDAAFVVRRQLTGPYGLAIMGGTRDPDAIFSRGKRHLFVVPWRGQSLVGVWHKVHERPPEATAPTVEQLQEFLDEINAAYPAFELSVDDVSLCLAGLTLFGDNQPNAKDLSYGKRSLIIDHRRADGIDNLVSVVGVRYTTARSVAEYAVDLVYEKLGRSAPKALTASTHVRGGNTEDMPGLLREASQHRPSTVTAEVIPSLVQNHGTAYREVFRHVNQDPDLGGVLGRSGVIQAEVVHAVRAEMAVKLADVVLRRTDLGTAGHPGEVALEACASLMARELGWGCARVSEELEEVRAAFPVRGAELCAQS